MLFFFIPLLIGLFGLGQREVRWCLELLYIWRSGFAHRRGGPVLYPPTTIHTLIVLYIDWYCALIVLYTDWYCTKSIVMMRHVDSMFCTRLLFNWLPIQAASEFYRRVFRSVEMYLVLPDTHTYPLNFFSITNDSNNTLAGCRNACRFQQRPTTAIK